MVFLVNAQEHTSRKLYCTDEDRAIFDRYCTQMEPKKSLPLDELMIHTALFFRGTPYVASTLEKEPEGLVVNLRELDCTTFAETVLALSRTLREEKTTFENFCENLQRLRYREGTIGDYTHPDSYKQLKNHPERVRRMADKEKEINLRPYYYVPRQEIDKCSSGIKNGDVLCFVTSIKGLDVTHVGIAYWKDGQLTFIHASSSAKKVIIQASSLRDYAEGIKSCKGVLVARPLSIH